MYTNSDVVDLRKFVSQVEELVSLSKVTFIDSSDDLLLKRLHLLVEAADEFLSDSTLESIIEG